MSDITELERRITAALDRIGTGLDGLEAPAPAGPDPETLAKLEAAEARAAELEQALTDEKLANAQLEERMKSVRETADRHASAMDIQAYEQQQTTARLDADLQRLRRAAEDLRASNLGLRDALEKGLAEPHLINKAMLAELETLRATRSVEIAQADTVLAALEPLVKRAVNDAANAKENSDA
ncbi:hypothetical protein [Planktotalea sp.]|uniref:hypothetical protein n=1 Tax=Planktotalea sp. TaxID=2029877 RepID=UPI003D6A1764